MTDTSAAIDRIVKLARESQMFRTIRLDSQRETLLVDRDGTIYERRLDPRQYVAHTISGLADLIADVNARESTKDVRVFVGRDGVSAILNEDESRSDGVHMFLGPAPSMEIILGAEKVPSFDQRDLIWILRSRFPGGLNPPSFLPDVRAIKFRDQSQGTTGVHQGRETVDLSVEKSVAGINDEQFPETITLTTPVYTQLATTGFRANVECAVDILVEERSFRIKPLEGQIEAAYDVAMRYIATEIEAELAHRDTPVGSSPIEILVNAHFDVRD